MPTEANGGNGLAVVAGDVLALRGTGLAAAETWALLCQAAQALQDLFLSNGGVVGGSRTGPVVTPHTLELTPRGRVLLQAAPPETARAYLPPEYRPGRVYSDTDSEKMWMYSLGRALLDTTPRVAALTGTVSVSPSSALQSVLAAMTEPDPRRRASLMNLLDVISEYCRTRMQSKPFTHTVMDMYREVVRSPQYAARKRAAYHQLNTLPPPAFNPADRPSQHHHHHQNHLHRHYAQLHCRQEQKDCHPEGQKIYQDVQQLRYQEQEHNRQQEQTSWQKDYQSRQQLYQDHGQLYMELQQKQYQERQQQQYQQQALYQEHQQNQRQQQNSVEQPAGQFSKQHHHHHPHRHPQKSALFKAQLRNSRSHPNLTSLCGQQQLQHHQGTPLNVCRTQFQSELDIKTYRSDVYSALPYDQEEQTRQSYHARTNSQPVYSQLEQARSNGNLQAIEPVDVPTDVYSDPIYALPVKPFLSSQDVRVNGLPAKSHAIHAKEDLHGGTAINRHRSSGGYSQPDIAGQLGERVREDTYTRTGGRRCPSLKRQHSNPQLSNRNSQEAAEFKRLSQPSIAAIEQYRCAPPNDEHTIQQQNPLSSVRTRGAQGPPKPPRIITTLRKTGLMNPEANRSEPPAKPPRNMVRNGPRARRGKAVQRAPSRLYRTVGGPMRCFNKAQCVGPEFVVRANQPAKTLCVGQIKAGNTSRVVVIMLTGQRLEVTCDPQKVTAGDLFQAIVVAENLDENFTLGLAVLLAGDFAMLPPETKLNKVAPPGWLNSGKSKGLLGLPTSFMLYLRLRFFLPSLRGIRNWISKHLLYLQIRRCILEQQLVCPFPELINLTGLALQAEFGNYNVNEHGCGDYFLLEHYVPESLILSMDQQRSDFNGDVEALKSQLHQAHRDRRGLDSNMAEEMFIVHAQALPDYGSHYYIATVDGKELEKVMTQQRREPKDIDNGKSSALRKDEDNIYDYEKSSEHPVYGRIEFTRLDSRENLPKIPYGDESKNSDVYEAQKNKVSRSNAATNNNNNDNRNNSRNSSSKLGKTKKCENSVWLAIHARGLKLFERGGEPRERKQLAEFQWRDIQTLSYSKSCLVVYSKLNGKRCKFKLRMDHRKSYFAFKLTSLHHQFFLKLRSELTSLQGLAKDFGVPTTIEPKSSPSKTKSSDGKTKIAIANTVKTRQRANLPMQLEEYQNKENENPQKDSNARVKSRETGQDQPGFYSSEEDALYAQVNVRLEPEGESRDTEDESERAMPISSSEPISYDDGPDSVEKAKLYGCQGIGRDTETESAYSAPKSMNKNTEQLDDTPTNPEDLYAAINKVGLSRKQEFPVPEEVWDVADVKKSLHKLKTSSLPNYATPKQSGGFRTPSLPRRLGVKMGTRAIYSSLVQKGTGLADEFESLSIKSDTASSIHSLSAQSTESPLPEAYVLNADIRTDDETFHVPDDESMSASLAARLEEMSFADERILHTIKLERGHGGSIGLQVTEGNDGGVYVQAVSVGGSADMAGNVNKGDRIVAINGQNLLNLRYEDALKMLQSSSETVELVLSQPTNRKQEPRHDNDRGAIESNYLHDIRFDISSEAEISTMTNKWLSQKTTDVASVQNTSSAYSSAASSAMGNHNANSMYLTDLVDNDDLKSASMLLSIEDFDVSRTSHESGAEPPVPPRRKNRKCVAAAAAKVERAKRPTAPARPKPAQRRLAPPPPQPQPPPPPPPPKAVRRNKPRNRESRADQQISRENAENNVNVLLNSTNKNRTNTLHLDDMDLIPTKEVTSDKIHDNAKVNSCSEHHFHPVFTNGTNADKYPPLFFTLHDFQNVMANSFTLAENIASDARRYHDENNDIYAYDKIEVSGAVIEEITSDQENVGVRPNVEVKENEIPLSRSSVVKGSLENKGISRILKESDRMESFFSAKSFENDEELVNRVTDIVPGKTDEFVRTCEDSRKNETNNISGGRNSAMAGKELETICAFDNEDEYVRSNVSTSGEALKSILDENNPRETEEKEAPVAKNLWVSLKAVQKFTANLSASENLKKTWKAFENIDLVDEGSKGKKEKDASSEKTAQSESEDSKENSLDYIFQGGKGEEKKGKEEIFFQIRTNESHFESADDVYEKSEGKSFFTENSFHADENEFYFRVTTTNVPFEKCLGRWETSFPSDDFADDESNSHIFEDYMDRSCRLNVRRSTAVFHCEDFDSLEEVRPTRSAPKVRFVIESPSSSTPDDDLEEQPDDSLQNIDSLVIDTVCGNRCVTTDASSECSAEDNSSSDLDSKEVAIDEGINNISIDPNARKDSCSETLDDSPDSVSTKQLPNDKSADDDLIETDAEPSIDKLEEIPDIRKDSGINSTDKLTDVIFEGYSSRPLGVLNSLIYTNVFGLSPCSYDDPPGDLSNANKAAGLQSILSDPEENPGLPKTQVYISDPTDASLPPARGNLSRQKYHDLALATETPDQRKKIPVIESLRELFNDDDDAQWSIANLEEFGDENNCEKLEDDLDEDPEMMSSKDVWSRKPLEKHFSMDLRDSVPVNVRRNSFLETMLSQDLTEEVWHVPTCRIIAFYPKTSTVQLKPLDEEESAEDKEEKVDVLGNPGKSWGKNCGVVEDCRSPSKYSCVAEETGKTSALGSIISDKDQTRKTGVKGTPLKIDSGARAFSPAAGKSSKIIPESRESVKIGNNVGLANSKNAQEAKSDVLNELLCNFSRIRLKPIKTREGNTLKIDQENKRDVFVGNPERYGESHEEAEERRRKVDAEGKKETRSVADKIEGRANRAAEELAEKISGKISLACRYWAKSSLSKSSASRRAVDVEKLSENISLACRKWATISGASGNNRKFLDESEIIVQVSPNFASHEEAQSSLGLKFTTRGEVESIHGEYPNASFRTMSGGHGQAAVTGLLDKKTDELSDGAEERGEEREEISVDPKEDTRIVETARLTSGAKCAIDRKSPPKHCNNNDNKRAAVDVSTDQSRDTLAIIPGSVRSFVKYYEIRSETTTNHSKSNVSFRKHHGRSSFRGPTGRSLQNRNFAAHNTSEAFQNAQDVFRKTAEKEPESRKGILRARPACKENVPDARTGESERTQDKNFEEPIRSSSRTGSSILKCNNTVVPKSASSPITLDNSGDIVPLGLIDNEIRYTVIARNVRKKPEEDSYVDVRWKVEEGRTCASTGHVGHVGAVKCERKKSVQFEGGCTVIDSASIFDEDESFPDVKTIRDKWESAGKPMGNPQADACESHERIAPITCPSSTKRPDVQRPVGREDPKNGRNSGTNSFVPQPETPQLVFYCTV